MNFVLNLVFQFFLLFPQKKISYKSKMIFSLIVSIISQILIPIVVLLFSDLPGFIMTSLIILIQGFANAIVLSTMYAMVSYLPFKYIIAMSSGQGIAGILMNVVRYILLLSFGDSSDETTINIEAIIFFSFASLFSFVCLILLFVNKELILDGL